MAFRGMFISPLQLGEEGLVIGTGVGRIAHPPIHPIGG